MHTTFDLAAPGAIDRLIAYHRAHFGDARMESDGGDNGATPADTTPPMPDGGEEPKGKTGDERGYPDKTPLAEMTIEQREAYWKHQARKHEARANERSDYDTLKAELENLRKDSETEHEAALREAREQGAREARETSYRDTVEALIRMGLRANGVADEDLDEIVDQANVTAFDNGNGLIDDDKIARFVQRNAGTARGTGNPPDMGQGKRGGSTTPSGMKAGAALYDSQYGKSA